MIGSPWLGLSESRTFRGMTSGRLVPEVQPDFFADLTGQSVPSIEHGQEDSSQCQSGIEPRLDELYRGQEPPQSLQCEILALQWHDDAVRRHQGVQREKSQGRRAIDDDVFIIEIRGANQPAKFFFPVLDFDELDFHTGQVLVGTDHIEERKAAAQNHFRQGTVSTERGVEIALRQRQKVDAQAARGIPLRIRIDEKRLPFRRGESRRQLMAFVVLPTPPF